MSHAPAAAELGTARIVSGVRSRKTESDAANWRVRTGSGSGSVGLDSHAAKTTNEDATAVHCGIHISGFLIENHS
jgi:hypothetical protein